MKRSYLKRTNGFKKPRKAMKGIRIDLADKYFSLFIRYRANWKCERCGTQYEVGSRGLHASHFWGRAREATRFDPENVVAHCHGCHAYLTASPEEHRYWKLKQIGQQRYDALMVRANLRQKKDRVLTAMIYKKAYEEEKDRYEHNGRT